MVKKKNCWIFFFAITVTLFYVPSLTLGFQNMTEDETYGRYIFDSKKHKIKYMPREILVKFKPGTAKENIAALQSVSGAKEMKRNKASKVRRIKFPPDISVKDAITLYETNPMVEYAEPNYIIKLCSMPNDPRMDLLWAMNNTAQIVNEIKGTIDADIDAPEAWDITTGSQNVIIAVIDTGVDYQHPELSSNIWRNVSEFSGQPGVDDDSNGYIDDVFGWDFFRDDPDPTDLHRHGTAVAGIIASEGNNEEAITGVNWKSSIMAIRVLGVAGTLGGRTDDAVEAIYYAVDNGAKIINISWKIEGFSQALYDAIKYADDNGVLIVAAAGNDGTDNDVTPRYPSSYDLQNIIAVAATDQNDNLTEISNYGNISVDVGAPGVNILSTAPTLARGTKVTVYTEDFDSSPSGWNFFGINNSWDIVSGTGVDATGCLEDSPAANYSDNTMSYSMMTTPIPSVKDNAYKISFSAKLQLELSNDALHSTAWDDSQTIVNEIKDEKGSYWDKSTNGQFLPHESFHYTTAADLFPEFYIGFLLETNNFNNFDGVYIDNLELSRQPIFVRGHGYLGVEGTSFAAPHVTGIAGLVLSEYPTYTHLQVKHAILNAVDVKDSHYNKVATGGRVNAFKALCSLPSPKNVSLVLHDDAVTLSWDPVTLNWDPNSKNGFIGYIISYGSAELPYYSTEVDVGNVTSSTIVDILKDVSYKFAVHAYAYFPTTGIINGEYSDQLVTNQRKTSFLPFLFLLTEF